MIDVLYVDDEPDLLDLGKAFLEMNGTFSVTTAESGAAGLDLMNSQSFDAIISDFLMPEMNGIVFLREVRKSSEIPFVLFTGKGREEVVIDAINSGADFYLQKGGDPTAQFIELGHKIQQAVSRRKAEAALRRRLDVIRETALISSQFLQLTPDKVDDAINDLLAIIGTKSGAERCSVAHLTGKPGEIIWSHEWFDKDVAARKDLLGTINLADFTQLVERMKAREAEIVPSVASLPRETDYDKKLVSFLESMGIRSFILIPLMTGSSVIGALGVSTLSKEFTWPEEDINILRIYGQIIAGALSRRAADRAIHESEELYRTVFESTGTAMMILEEDKTVSRVNREFERISGYSREEVCGRMPWTRFVSPEDVRRMQEYHVLRRNNPEKVPVNYEFQFLTRDGHTISTYITVEMIPKTKQSVVSLIDISKEKAAQQQVTESEEKFRSLAESLVEGIYMIQDTRYIYVNPPFARIFGSSVEEILAVPDYTSIFVQEDQQRVRDSVGERLAGLKDSARYFARGSRPDGTVVPIVIQGSKTSYKGRPAIIGTVTLQADACPPPTA